jgi:hypothetical protein
MLWALTKPLFDASTDLGAIAPLIVFTKTIFFAAVSSCPLAGLIGLAVAVRRRQETASEIFLTSLRGTRSLYWL